jgi:hypothetical protein
MRLSDLRTHFVAAPNGPTLLTTYYGAANGVPRTGVIRLGTSFRGKKRMGLDESTFLSEQDIAAARMIFRVTGNASTNATINFRQSAPTDTNIVYHFNIRPNDAVIIQNTLNGGWGGEERVSYAAAGLVAGQAFTLYIAMSPSVISVQNAARGIVHNYTNRMSSTPVFSVDSGGFATVERVLV